MSGYEVGDEGRDSRCGSSRACTGIQPKYRPRNVKEDGSLASRAPTGYYNDLHTQRGWRGYLPLAVRYILALVLLIVLDAIWMQLIAKYALGIDYFAIVQDIQNSKIAWRWEGLLAYLVLGYAAAFMTRGPTLQISALKGTEIGFVIYAVFDFTTTFMFHGWTLKVAILDTIWGTLMYTFIGFTLAYVETTSLWQRL